MRFFISLWRIYVRARARAHVCARNYISILHFSLCATRDECALKRPSCSPMDYFDRWNARACYLVAACRNDPSVRCGAPRVGTKWVQVSPHPPSPPPLLQPRDPPPHPAPLFSSVRAGPIMCLCPCVFNDSSFRFRDERSFTDGQPRRALPQRDRERMASLPVKPAIRRISLSRLGLSLGRCDFRFSPSMQNCEIASTVATSDDSFYSKVRKRNLFEIFQFSCFFHDIASFKELSTD